ncbi:putative Phosphatase inhibitor 2 protein [Daphnia magna]|uniref:Putative Phosphatase inhibitor 2 protein n=1 Tax=Daphnia magna TaxID=35525 RepID=A0A164V5F1_9CRUS|nr:putative Phosphatase inhibitor 2 protein [Daphnia magna]
MAGNEEIPAQKNESSVSEDEEEETPNDKGTKRRSFEHKRKSHYNEFMAVKLARQLMQKDEEEVENNEEERLAEKDIHVEVKEPVDDVEGMDIIDQSQTSS